MLLLTLLAGYACKAFSLNNSVTCKGEAVKFDAEGIKAQQINGGGDSIEDDQLPLVDGTSNNHETGNGPKTEM